VTPPKKKKRPRRLAALAAPPAPNIATAPQTAICATAKRWHLRLLLI
jgi:hypothetical protein